MVMKFGSGFVAAGIERPGASTGAVRKLKLLTAALTLHPES